MAGNNLERRDFLKLCGATALGGTVFPSAALFGQHSETRNERFRLSKPRWIIYENGNYDLISDEIILKNCCPAINGQTVMPKNVFLGDSPRGRRIIYELSGGFLMLDLKTNKDSLTIGTEFSGFSQAPRWFYPISQAEVFGADHFFRQGFGSGGPSGVMPIKHISSLKQRNEKNSGFWSYDSYMTFALMGRKETIAIGNIDHNDFLHRSSIYNRFHHQRLGHRELTDEHIFFEAAMLLNQTKIENEYVKLPDLHFYTGNKPFETLQVLAWRISRKTDAQQTPVTSYHWVTPPEPAEPFSLKKLQSQIEKLNNLNPALPVHTISVSKGYCMTGDWLEPNDRWPGGLDRIAREIFKHGYRAGIWTAPFIVAENSKLYQKHPDWVIRDFEEKPIIEDVDQEGTFFALDISHPGAKEYLARVYRSLRKMGFIFYETGYMESGLKDSFRVKRAFPGKSSVQIFREALQLIRNEIGAGSLWMASQTPYAPVIGFADIVRLNYSGSRNWGENTLRDIINETYYSQYFNHILWQNNPCEIDLSENSPLSDDEKTSLALWFGILGGTVGTNGDFGEWETQYLSLFRFIEPDRRPLTATFPFWPSSEEIKIAVRYYKQFYSWGILFLNDQKKYIKKIYKISELIDTNSGFIFQWKPDIPLGFGELPEISVALEPHQSKLFWVSEYNQSPPQNLTLGGRISEGL